MTTEENRGNTMRNDLDDWQRKANEAQKNYEDSSKQNKTQELEISELKQQLTLMKYQIESLEIEKKDKYQLQEKLTAAEQKYKELLKRNEREEGEFSSVENLNEILKGENLQLRVDIGREREEKDSIEIKVSNGLFLPTLVKTV
jgi:myosin heavy subunit